MSAYLILDLVTLGLPLALSFDKKVAFYKKWKFLFPAILVMAIIFLIWDHFFTTLGVWEFNPDYVMDLRIWSMPLEEYLFFLAAPYACVFIYECIRAYFPKDYLFRFRRVLTLLLLATALVLWYFHSNHLYTSVTMLGLSILLVCLLFWKRNLDYMGWFYMAYAICLIPFGIVNGFLTGLPVLIYKDAENMGIRLGSIPLDDFFYNLFMLLLTIAVYEKLKRKFS